MTMRLKHLSLLGLAVFFAGATGSQAQVDKVGGTLVLSGGIHGTVRLNAGNCETGPAATFNLTGASGGGWGLLFLKASDPPGKRGAASVVLEGEGYKSYDGAVASWEWSAKKNSGHSAKPSFDISPDGEMGTIKQVLSVDSSYNGPHVNPVAVTASWNAGTCKTSE